MWTPGVGGACVLRATAVFPVRTCSWCHPVGSIRIISAKTQASAQGSTRSDEAVSSGRDPGGGGRTQASGAMSQCQSLQSCSCEGTVGSKSLFVGLSRRKVGGGAGHGTDAPKEPRSQPHGEPSCVSSGCFKKHGK